MIRQIEKEELRTMHGREGLVLQGCGGDLKEWTDGINQMLEQEGILPKGKRLDDVAVFRNEGMTNLLFFFGEEKLDIGKMAVWRLKTHLQFGGTWMSDYVNNQLGGFLHEAMAEKPNCALIGEDGNIFNLMGIAARPLRENGMEDKAAVQDPGKFYTFFSARRLISWNQPSAGRYCSRPGMGDSTLVIRKGMLLFPSCPLVRESIFCSGFSLPESGKVSKTRLTGLVVFSYRIFMTGSLSSTIASSPSCHCQAAIPSPSRPSQVLLFL